MLSRCVLCTRYPEWALDLCAPCFQSISAQIQEECTVLEIGALKILALAHYRGPFKGYVRFLKGSGASWKINSLNTLQQLGKLIPEPPHFFNADSLCSVPSSRMRELDSFSLSTALALEVSRRFRIPVLHPQPKRNFWSDLFLETDQKHKSLRDRGLVATLWDWPERLAPAPSSCLLVDDVVTTGASLVSLQKGLRARGYHVTHAVALMHSEKLT